MKAQKLNKDIHLVLTDDEFFIIRAALRELPEAIGGDGWHTRTGFEREHWEPLVNAVFAVDFPEQGDPKLFWKPTRDSGGGNTG